MFQPLFPKCYKEKSKPHKFCPGCGHGIALKELGFALDELKIAKNTLIGLDIGCALLAWDFFDIDTIQTHHGRTVPVISGYKIVRPDKVALAYLGDGGAYAIGLQALITACHRNDPITVIVVNNTLYGMTGGQMAPTTLCGEITTTTPKGRSCEISRPFLGPELLATVCAPTAYLAREIISQPIKVREKIKKAIENQMKNHSFSFVEVLSICPVNWRKDARESLNYLEKEMVKYFPLGEIECKLTCQIK